MPITMFIEQFADFKFWIDICFICKLTEHTIPLTIFSIKLRLDAIVKFFQTFVALTLAQFISCNTSHASTFPLDAKFKENLQKENSDESQEHKIIFYFGSGGLMLPRYVGSKDYRFVPIPIMSPSYVNLPFLPRTFGSIDGKRKFEDGPFMRPSLGIINPRNSEDSEEFAGLKNINWAYESGIAAGYRIANFEGYLKLRRGFLGYNGYRGEVGSILRLQPNERTSISFDSHLTFADSNFVDTYFGVSESEAQESKLFDRAFTGETGITSANLEANLTHDITENQRLHFNVRYSRLLFDVGDSPIVENGSANQFYVRAGTSFKIILDIFDGN